MHFNWNIILPCTFLKTKMISVVQYKWRIKISDQFSGVIVCQQKADLKQPALPCCRGLKILLFFRQLFWNSCMCMHCNNIILVFFVKLVERKEITEKTTILEAWSYPEGKDIYKNKNRSPWSAQRILYQQFAKSKQRICSKIKISIVKNIQSIKSLLANVTM